jgi:hypothetical protein
MGLAAIFSSLLLGYSKRRTSNSVLLAMPIIVCASAWSLPLALSGYQDIDVENLSINSLNPFQCAIDLRQTRPPRNGSASFPTYVLDRSACADFWGKSPRGQKSGHEPADRSTQNECACA